MVAYFRTATFTSWKFTSRGKIHDVIYTSYDLKLTLSEVIKIVEFTDWPNANSQIPSDKKIDREVTKADFASKRPRYLPGHDFVPI